MERFISCKMLNTKEVAECLGITIATVRDFIDLGMLKPIFLGKGFKFGQEQLLDFQREYAGLDISNREKMLEVLEQKNHWR